jgi:glyoxylase-like metal-dependent hydrolase (beta-lactamase superfamily II)
MKENLIHQFELGASNCFIITGGEPVIVDTGTDASPEVFRAICASCGLEPSDIQLIIISHEHADHFVNLDWMKEMTGGAPVLCHKAAERSLAEGLMPQVTARNTIGEEAIKSPPSLSRVPRVRPDITFESEYDLAPFGIAGKVISTPGHSEGSTAVVLDSGEAIVGDTVVRCHGGDELVIAFLADDVPALRRSVEMLLSSVTLFYSGHGGPYTREEVQAALERDSLWGSPQMHGKARG